MLSFTEINLITLVYHNFTVNNRLLAVFLFFRNVCDRATYFFEIYYYCNMLFVFVRFPRSCPSVSRNTCVFIKNWLFLLRDIWMNFKDIVNQKYSWFSTSRTLRGLKKKFEISRVRLIKKLALKWKTRRNF